MSLSSPTRRAGAGVCPQLTHSVIPDVRRARKPQVFGCEPYDPESRSPTVKPSFVIPGYRTARFSNEIKDFGKTGFRYDIRCGRGPSIHLETPPQGEQEQGD